MVNGVMIVERALDDVFGALASPARRSMLRRLQRGDAIVSELAAPLAMSAPAVTKHLRVLEDAGLVERFREGRVHRIRLRRAELEPASAWLTQFWAGAFDALAARLDAGGSDDG